MVFLSLLYFICSHFGKPINASKPQFFSLRNVINSSAHFIRLLERMNKIPYIKWFTHRLVYFKPFAYINLFIFGKTEQTERRTKKLLQTWKKKDMRWTVAGICEIMYWYSVSYITDQQKTLHFNTGNKVWGRFYGCGGFVWGEMTHLGCNHYL